MLSGPAAARTKQLVPEDVFDSESTCENKLSQIEKIMRQKELATGVLSF